MPVIRNPLTTKNSRTPKKPKGAIDLDAGAQWLAITPPTANALKASSQRAFRWQTGVPFNRSSTGRRHATDVRSLAAWDCGEGVSRV
jgi:hypothetical protein